MTHHFSGVLFDLDGVVVDSQAAIVRLWHGLAERHDRELTADAIALDVLGCSPEHTVSRLFGDLPPAGRQQVLDAVRRAEPGLEFEEMAGAREVIAELHSAGVPLGLVTGASAGRAERVLERLGLREAFAATVTWGETARGKPAPDCYELGARRLSREPSRCLVFEDAPSGVAAATAAGAVCMGVGGPGLLSAGATWTVPDLLTPRILRGSNRTNGTNGTNGAELIVGGRVLATLSTALPRPSAARGRP